MKIILALAIFFLLVFAKINIFDDSAPRKRVTKIENLMREEKTS